MSIKYTVALTFCLTGFVMATPAAAAERPNIVWFVVDDMSANFSCYGEKTIQTPHVDRLAQEGVRFSRAYATSPVCSDSSKLKAYVHSDDRIKLLAVPLFSSDSFVYGGASTRKETL